MREKKGTGIREKEEKEREKLKEKGNYVKEQGLERELRTRTLTALTVLIHSGTRSLSHSLRREPREREKKREK